jgi:hypothetical protein
MRRRRVLAAGTVAVIAGLAGCSGNTGDDEPTDTETDDYSTERTSSTTNTTSVTETTPVPSGVQYVTVPDSPDLSNSVRVTVGLGPEDDPRDLEVLAENILSEEEPEHTVASTSTEESVLGATIQIPANYFGPGNNTVTASLGDSSASDETTELRYLEEFPFDQSGSTPQNWDDAPPRPEEFYRQAHQFLIDNPGINARFNRQDFIDETLERTRQTHEQGFSEIASALYGAATAADATTERISGGTAAEATVGGAHHALEEVFDYDREEKTVYLDRGPAAGYETVTKVVGFDAREDVARVIGSGVGAEQDIEQVVASLEELGFLGDNQYSNENALALDYEQVRRLGTPEDDAKGIFWGDLIKQIDPFKAANITRGSFLDDKNEYPTLEGTSRSFDQHDQLGVIDALTEGSDSYAMRVSDHLRENGFTSELMYGLRRDARHLDSQALYEMPAEEFEVGVEGGVGGLRLTQRYVS